MELNHKLAVLHRKQFSQEIESICKKYNNVPLNTSLVTVKDGTVVHTNEMDRDRIKTLYFCSESSQSPVTDINFLCDKYDISLPDDSDSLIHVGSRSSSNSHDDLDDWLCETKLDVKPTKKVDNWDTMSCVSLSHFKGVEKVAKAVAATGHNLSWSSHSSANEECSEARKIFDENCRYSSTFSSSSASDDLAISPALLKAKLSAFDQLCDNYDNWSETSSTLSVEQRKPDRICSVQMQSESCSNDDSSLLVSKSRSSKKLFRSKSQQKLKQFDGKHSVQVCKSYSSDSLSDENSVFSSFHSSGVNKLPKFQTDHGLPGGHNSAQLRKSSCWSERSSDENSFFDVLSALDAQQPLNPLITTRSAQMERRRFFSKSSSDENACFARTSQVPSKNRRSRLKVQPNSPPLTNRVAVTSDIESCARSEYSRDENSILSEFPISGSLNNTSKFQQSATPLSQKCSVQLVSESYSSESSGDGNSVFNFIHQPSISSSFPRLSEMQKDHENCSPKVFVNNASKQCEDFDLCRSSSPTRFAFEYPSPVRSEKQSSTSLTKRPEKVETAKILSSPSSILCSPIRSVKLSESVRTSTFRKEMPLVTSDYSSPMVLRSQRNPTFFSKCASQTLFKSKRNNLNRDGMKVIKSNENKLFTTPNETSLSRKLVPKVKDKAIPQNIEKKSPNKNVRFPLKPCKVVLKPFECVENLYANPLGNL